MINKLINKPKSPLAKALAKAKRERWEDEFQRQLVDSTALPADRAFDFLWTREYRFELARLWRLDFAWPQHMVAVEIEGGTWSNGRHTRGSGFENDCEKYNRAAQLGWAVGRFTVGMVKNGEALSWTEKVLRSKALESHR